MIRSFFTIILFSQITMAQTPIEQAIIDAKKTSSEVSSEKKESESEKLDKQLSEEKTKLTETEKKIEVESKKENNTQTKESTDTYIKLSKEESLLLKRRMKSLKERPDLIAAQNENDSKNIYSPSPVFRKKTTIQNEESVKSAYTLERDSGLILHQPISYKDTFNVQMCFNAGLTLTLDESIKTTIQTAIVDDLTMIGATVLDNKRGAYIHLKQPIPEGQYLETAIRLVRKEDDKTYFINIIAQPCPRKELIPFPRIIYLKEKDNVSLAIQKKNPLLTPQDTIITESLGFPRIPKKRITVYDMVASPGSEYVVFGVEIQVPDKNKEKFDLNTFKFTILDNIQINKIQSQFEYLPVPSAKVTEMRGVSTLRFKATVQINKKYIQNDRYIYLMFVDKEEKHYQYVPVDTLPYFKSLIDRGFDL